MSNPSDPMDQYQPWSDDSKRILAAFGRLLSELGGGSGVLAVFNSWGDTLPDKEIAELAEELLEERTLAQIKRFALRKLQDDVKVQ